MSRLLSAAALTLTLLSNPLSAEDWPSFRGPQGNGISAEETVPTEWGPQQNIKWKIAMPGTGNGSPIVSNGRVFVTYANADGTQRGMLCINRTDGKILWNQAVNFDKVEETHKTNPHAGTTPAANGDRVVVWHGSAGLHCYDFEGKALWSRDLGVAGHMWGYGSSPIIVGNKVILNFGPGEESFLIAVDLNTGEDIWRTEEPGGDNKKYIGSWSTPVVAEVNGEKQLICSMASRVVGYDLEKGTELWSVGGLPSARSQLVYTSPVISGDIGIAMGGFKGPAIGFKLGGEGDVTKSNRLWQTEEGQPQRIGSGVIVGDHLYMANAGPGTVQCIAIETGEVQWQARLAGDNWASVVLANGNLYATSQNGTVTVFKPNPEEYEEVAVNKLNETTNSTPAFSNGEIFLRTYPHLYCISE